MKKDGRTKRDSDKPSDRDSAGGISDTESSDTLGAAIGTSVESGIASSATLASSESISSKHNESGNADGGNFNAELPDEGDSGASTGDSGEPVRRGRGRPRGSGARGNRSDRNTGGGRTGTNSSEENNAQNSDTEIPGTVNFDNLFKFPTKSSKTNPTIELAKLLDTVYKMPYHAGLGEHWPLDNVEAKDFAIALLNAKNSLTKAQQNWIEKFLREYAPLVALAGIMYAINAPRLMESYQMYESRKLAKQKTSNINTGNSLPTQSYPTGTSSESIAKTPFARSITNDFASRVAGNDE